MSKVQKKIKRAMFLLILLVAYLVITPHDILKKYVFKKKISKFDNVAPQIGEGRDSVPATFPYETQSEYELNKYDFNLSRLFIVSSFPLPLRDTMQCIKNNIVREVRASSLYLTLTHRLYLWIDRVFVDLW